MIEVVSFEILQDIAGLDHILIPSTFTLSNNDGVGTWNLEKWSSFQEGIGGG